MPSAPVPEARRVYTPHPRGRHPAGLRSHHPPQASVFACVYGCVVGCGSGSRIKCGKMARGNAPLPICSPPHTLSSCAERNGDPGPLTTSRGALHSRYAAIIVWVTAWGPRLLVMRCVRIELVSRTALPGDQWQATEPGSGFHPSTSRFSAASFSRLGS
ncbi:hypothetical protein PsAD37_04840 [Pseudovibrio sp. Ad37]|nr:hypothetical protein PsAD37_04840 [Pseudovibrio sp. Ad37]